MSSPDYNQTFIKDLIINKLYEVGQLDENQKNNSYDNVNNHDNISNSRHFIMKVIGEFLKTPNKHMIAQIRIIEETKRTLSQRAPLKIIQGSSILSKGTISEEHAEQIPNGVQACAVELIGKYRGLVDQKK